MYNQSMNQEINFDIEFSPEQIEAMQRVIAAVESVWDALMEMVRAFMEAVLKAFEPLVRLLAKMQLLEWRLPCRLAEFLSRKIPAWLAYDLGFKWFHSKVQDLE